MPVAALDSAAPLCTPWVRVPGRHARVLPLADPPLLAAPESHQVIAERACRASPLAAPAARKVAESGANAAVVRRRRSRPFHALLVPEAAPRLYRNGWCGRVRRPDRPIPQWSVRVRFPAYLYYKQ